MLVMCEISLNYEVSHFYEECVIKLSFRQVHKKKNRMEWTVFSFLQKMVHLKCYYLAVLSVLYFH